MTLKMLTPNARLGLLPRHTRISSSTARPWIPSGNLLSSTLQNLLGECSSCKILQKQPKSLKFGYHTLSRPVASAYISNIKHKCKDYSKFDKTSFINPPPYRVYPSCKPKATKSDMERNLALEYLDECEFEEDHSELETTVVDKICLPKSDIQKKDKIAHGISSGLNQTEWDKEESHPPGFELSEFDTQGASEDPLTDDLIKKQKRTTRKPPTAKTDKGNHLTVLEESRLLAEIDALLSPVSFAKKPYLEEATKVVNDCIRKDYKLNIDIFNKLMEGTAAYGSSVHVQLLLNNIRSLGLEPNFQMYAFIIQGFERLKDVENLRNIVEEMEQKGYRTQDIFQRCILTEQQSISILRALKSLDPTYAPEKRWIHIDKHLSPLLVSLKNAKFNGANLEYHQPFASNNEELKDFAKEQLKREEKGMVLIPSIGIKELSDKDKKRKEMYAKITEEWRNSLLVAVKEVSKLDGRLKIGEKRGLKARCLPYLHLLDIKEFVDITMSDTVPKLCAQPSGIPVNYVCRHLGNMLYSRYNLRYRQKVGVIKKVEDIYQDYGRYSLDQKAIGHTSPREKWNRLERSCEILGSLDVCPPYWPNNVKALISGTLMNCLLNVATIDTNIFRKNKEPKIVPAISHTYSYFKGKRFGQFEIHPVMARLFKSHILGEGEIAMETDKLPMLSPPRPWTAYNQGGYLIQSVPFVRTLTENGHMKELKERSRQGKLNAVFDSLNYLGTCAWKVNEKVLDIVKEIFNGEGDMKLEVIGPNLPTVPTVPDLKQGDNSMDLKIERKKVKKVYHELYALRMDLLYKLSVTDYFKKSVFWLPSNLDFRGRVYPVPHHCSHIGSDVGRGMLSFARGRPLGKKGLDWLKIHLVNLHGAKKKASLPERVQYVDEQIEDILDSADNPLEGRKWWQTADEPWQCLATCMEIANAVRSPDPSQFVSHLPVHQDGSCNGLQHYAAMGRDEYGARHVCLTPSDRPEDLYSEVAKLVEKKRLADASSGVSIAQQLEGKVKRKVVKQTVMTVAYGVTFIGGKRQIEKQLKELEVPDEIMFEASTYLTRCVFASLGEMFSAATSIQDWLTVAAGQVALTGHCMEWFTPLELPVVQPYRKETVEEVRTPLQKIAVSTLYDNTQQPDLVKQKAGFPPNFVHSLDSCHMMLTSLFCQKQGITFASVHDSFWTHAADVDTMNKICREQFVNLHSQPILRRLQDDLQNKFGGMPLQRKTGKIENKQANFDGLPQQGSFELENVLESTYFFS